MSDAKAKNAIDEGLPKDLDDTGDPKVRLQSIFKNVYLRRLMADNMRMQWRLYVVAVIAMIGVALSTAGTAYVMKHIIDAMTLPEYKDYVLLVAAGVAGIFIVKGIATYIQTVAMTRAGLRIVASLQSRIYKKLLGQGIRFFNEQESSSLVLRVTHGANAARSITDILLTAYVRDILTVVGLVGVMVYQQPFLSIFALLVGPAGLIAVRQLIAISRRLADQEMSSLTEIIRVMQETSTGVRVIKAFALEKHMSRRMDKAIDDVETRGIVFARIQAVLSPLMDSLSGIAIAVIVALSAFDFFGLSRTTPGSLMSFITALLMAYEPAKRLMRARLQIERNMYAVQRLFGLLDARESMREAPDAQPLPEGGGEVRFEDVTFSYGAKNVLHTVSTVFEAGKTTALVGPSGGGKSTMMNLILRMYDPTEGRVLIDGMDIRTATIDSLRRKMAFVSQDTFLFSATVMENLRIGREDATDDEIIDAAKIAHAHEFIEQLPQGYLTEIGENGAFLSGGQKQRLSIARAVVRGAPILLLDEATSALDATSEALVRDALHQISADVTTIVIAHRLSTILTADCICYVEAGQIVERGTLPDLLERNGKFRDLYDKQFRGVAGT